MQTESDEAIETSANNTDVGHVNTKYSCSSVNAHVWDNAVSDVLQCNIMIYKRRLKLILHARSFHRE